MIHGRDRDRVGDLVVQASWLAGLDDCDRAVLFSRRCFKQRGARYDTGAGEVNGLSNGEEARP